LYLCDPENVLKIDQIQQMLESVLNAVNMQLALMSMIEIHYENLE